jgi:hypothetical protein
MYQTAIAAQPENLIADNSYQTPQGKNTRHQHPDSGPKQLAKENSIND